MDRQLDWEPGGLGFSLSAAGPQDPPFPWSLCSQLPGVTGDPLLVSPWASPCPGPERTEHWGQGEGAGACDDPLPRALKTTLRALGCCSCRPTHPTRAWPSPYLMVLPNSPLEDSGTAGNQVGQCEHRCPAPSPSKLHGGAQPWAPRDQAGAPGVGRPSHQHVLGLECSGHHVLQEVRRARVGGAEAGPCLGPCSHSTLRRG